MPRYGLTPDRIARVTERRRAGDWAGACELAGIEVAPELAAAPPPVLRHLVPDLLRWHATRLGGGTTVSRLGLTARRVERVLHLPLRLHPDGAAAVALAVGWYEPFRMRLRTVPAADYAVGAGLHLAPELWDARHTGGLLARCGGVTRLPYFTADGARLPAGDLAGDSPEGRVEAMFEDLAAGRVAAAWAAAGVDLDRPASDHLRFELSKLTEGFAPGLPTLATAARAVATAAGAPAVVLTPPHSRINALVLDRLDTDRPLLTALRHDSPRLPAIPLLPGERQDRPAVWTDLLNGRVTVAELHPLVGAALFPARSAPTGPNALGLPAPAPVACGGATHTLAFAAGVLASPEHAPAELERELALHALGGAEPTGCAGAYTGWRLGRPELPAPLADFRRELYARVKAGEADTLQALLDAGLDPRCRDREGRTLLHLLPHLLPRAAQPALLTRLLAAGLDPRAADLFRTTPLAVAERAEAPPAVLDTLRAGSGGT